MEELLTDNADSPYKDFKFDIDTIQKLSNFKNMNSVEAIQLMVQQKKNLEILSEQKKTYTEKCQNVPGIIARSACTFFLVGILSTWLIFSLILAKSDMYYKKWTGEAILDHACYELKQSCHNSTIICDKQYNKCELDNDVFKESWLKTKEVSYGDKVKNIFNGTTMYNDEGGAIYGTFVVYVFLALSLFLLLLVVIYKIYYLK